MRGRSSATIPPDTGTERTEGVASLGAKSGRQYTHCTSPPKAALWRISCARFPGLSPTANRNQQPDSGLREWFLGCRSKSKEQRTLLGSSLNNVHVSLRKESHIGSYPQDSNVNIKSGSSGGGQPTTSALRTRFDATSFTRSAKIHGIHAVGSLGSSSRLITHAHRDTKSASPDHSGGGRTG